MGLNEPPFPTCNCHVVGNSTRPQNKSDDQNQQNHSPDHKGHAAFGGNHIIEQFPGHTQPKFDLGRRFNAGGGGGWSGWCRIG